MIGSGVRIWDGDRETRDETQRQRGLVRFSVREVGTLTSLPPENGTCTNRVHVGIIMVAIIPFEMTSSALAAHASFLVPLAFAIESHPAGWR